MVEQTPKQEKNVSPDDANGVYLGKESTISDVFSFLERTFPFLGLWSEELSNFPALSTLATLGYNCSGQLDNRPSSLRPRKVKLSRGKKSWSSFPFLPRDTLCLAEGIYIPSHFPVVFKMYLCFPLISQDIYTYLKYQN